MAIRIDTAFQAVYIHEPEGHNVPALNTAWTVAGMYRVEADVNLDTLIVALYGTTAAGSWVGLYMNADGITCRLEGWNGSGSPVVSGSYTLEVGRDYRLAIDYNGSGTVRMLLDGVVALSLSFTPVAGTAGERSLQWGGYGELAGYTSCTLARWRMWSAVLTETEHRAEYRSTVPVRTSGLLHNWPMNPGATRLDDTVAGQPDLFQNPAVPVGDGTAFVHRPSIIGTPVFYDLGQTTSPGAQAVTVPPWAEHVGLHITASDNAAAPYGDLASLAANFVSAFTRTNGNAPVTAAAAGGWVATAPVSSSAAGRTFTPTFTEGSPLAGANAWLYFMQDTTGATARGTGQASGAGGDVPGTASAAGVADGLAIAVDMHLSATTANYPGQESGWTSPAGGTQQSTGAFAYFSGTRLRTKPITASGTESATTQGPLGSVVTLATWAPKPLTAPATMTTAASLAAAVRIARTASASAAVAVREGKTTSTAMAAAIRETRSAQTQLAAAVDQARAASMVLNLGVQAAAQTGTSADAVVQRALLAASSLDLAVSQAQAAATAVSLQVQAGSAASTSVGLMVQAGAAQSASVAVLVQALRQAAQSVEMAVQQARAATLGLAAVVQIPNAMALGVTLAAQAGRTAGASIDLQVQEGATVAMALQAAVRFAAQASTSLSAAVGAVATAGISVSAAVSLQNSVGAAVEAAILASRTAGMGLTLYVDDPTVELVIEEAFIARPAARNWTARNPRWGSS